MRGEFVDVGGVRMYYYAAGTRGAGEPILLLHGFPTSGHLWTNVVPHLPDGHRAIVVDLLGFGRSDRPGTQRVSIGAHADRMIAFLDALGVRSACVAGHDVGAAIALSMALRHPHRVSRLALLSAAAFDEWPTRAVKLARAMLPLTRSLPANWLLAILRRELLRGYANVDTGARSIERYMRPFADADGRDAFVQHLDQLDPAETVAMTPRLRGLVQPTAVVWGRQNPFTPARTGSRLQAEIPEASLTVLEDGCHFIPEEAPQEVAAAIQELLSR